jgi:hypothetical protein
VTGYLDDPTPSFTTGGPDADKLDTVLGWMPGSSTYPPLPSTLILIPCATAKLDVGAAARDLYVSDHFELALRAAEARAAAVDARVAIISAKHGLVTLTRVLAPYDCQHVRTTEALLPSRYLAVVREALEFSNPVSNSQMKCPLDVQLDIQVRRGPDRLAQTERGPVAPAGVGQDSRPHRA